MLVLMSAALGQLKCKRLITLHLRSTAPKKNDLYIHCASLFFCKGVRDLNGTLRKQHSALFLVPGVSTALAAQKIVFFSFSVSLFQKT